MGEAHPLASVQQLTATGEQHKRDRDEAMREAAKLEGRLSALQGQLDEAKAEVRRLQQTRPIAPSGGAES